MKLVLLVEVLIGIVILAIILFVIYLFITSNSPSPSLLSDESSNQATRENALFNTYVGCLKRCRTNSSEYTNCVEGNCYPALVQGLTDLGYKRPSPDSVFISKLSLQNQKFISCLSLCDEMEDGTKRDNCIDSCFAER